MTKFFPIEDLTRLYGFLKEGFGKTSNSSVPGWQIEQNERHFINYTYSPRPDMPSPFIIDDQFGPPPQWQWKPYYNPDFAHYLTLLYSKARNYRKSIPDKTVKKKKLAQSLARFDSLATHKPIFYADIYSKFKGNYAKYVDNLFHQSILCNKRRMEKFVRYPKARDLQKDPGVQFVIGLALYELWIKDVREGKVKDEPSH